MTDDDLRPRHLTTVAFGGVTALGAATAATVAARRAVPGGGDSLPDSSPVAAAAVTVLALASAPLVATCQSALDLIRHRADRLWRGLPDAAVFDRDGLRAAELLHDGEVAVRGSNL